MKTEHEKLTVFIDTNILLHYLPISEIDWLKICRSKQVKIILCMQVIHELDEKKDDINLGKRASKRIKEIKEIRSGKKNLNGKIIFDIFSYEPRDEDFAESMSPTNGDDRIIQSLLKYMKEKPSESLTVVTEDMGMMIKCEAHEIKCIEPLDIQRLPNPISETDKEYRKVVAELNGLKNRQPRIEFFLKKSEEEDCTKKPLEFILEKQAICIERELEFELYALRPDLLPEASITDLTTGKKHKSNTDPYAHLDNHDKQKYFTEVENHLKQYEEWLIEQKEISKVWPTAEIKFWIEIANNGNSPDEDIDLYFDFPPKFRFLSSEKENIGNPPQKPGNLISRPVRPKTYTPRRFNGGGILALLGKDQSSIAISPQIAPSLDLHFPSINTNYWDDLTGDIEKGFSLRIFQAKLNHHKRSIWGPYKLVFKSWDDVETFNVKTCLMSCGSPDKQEKKHPYNNAAQRNLANEIFRLRSELRINENLKTNKIQQNKLKPGKLINAYLNTPRYFVSLSNLRSNV